MRKLKKLILAIFVIVIVFIVAIIFAQNILKSKLEYALTNNISKDIQVSYSDLKLNLFKGEVVLTNLKVIKTIDSLSQVELECIAKQIKVSNVSYFKYVINRKINIGTVKIEEPIIDYYKIEHHIDKKSKKTIKKEINKLIDIGHFKIVKGNFSIYDAKTDSLKLQAKSLNLIITDLVIGKENERTKSPILFKEFDIEFKDFYSQVSQYDNITFSHGHINSDGVLMTDLKLFTKYNKYQFSKIIPRERDHFTIHIDSLAIDKPRYFYENDSILNVRIDGVELSNPNIGIYRNKLNLDDTRSKLMYSKMLRDLKFKLLVDSLLIKNAQVSYTEKVKIDGNPGEINFSNLVVKLKNLGNAYSKTETTVIFAHGNFMNAPFKIDWRFNVHDLDDRFVFKCEMDNLHAENLNPFIEPNLNKRMEGNLERTIFKIDGNHFSSNVDLKIKYDHFGIIVLKKNKRGVNKVLSKGFNAFVSKTSSRTKDGYKHGLLTDIQRDNTKSVFGYILKNLELGLLKAMTLE